MRVIISRKAFIAFCVTLSILTGFSFCSYINPHYLFDSGQCVPYTKILNLTGQALSAISEMEVSHPGHSTAGDSTFLKSYQQSVTDLNEAVVITGSRYIVYMPIAKDYYFLFHTTSINLL